MGKLGRAKAQNLRAFKRPLFFAQISLLESHKENFLGQTLPSRCLTGEKTWGGGLNLSSSSILKAEAEGKALQGKVPEAAIALPQVKPRDSGVVGRKALKAAEQGSR